MMTGLKMDVRHAVISAPDHTRLFIWLVYRPQQWGDSNQRAPFKRSEPILQIAPTERRSRRVQHPRQKTSGKRVVRELDIARGAGAGGEFLGLALSGLRPQRKLALKTRLKLTALKKVRPL
jgi:hypothetical protein